MSARMLRRGLLLGMLAAVVGGGALPMAGSTSARADFDWNSSAYATSASQPDQQQTYELDDFDWN